MEGKIGRVTLDLSLYPGKDLYSDGPVEEELLQIAKNHKEEELNQVIGGKGKLAGTVSFFPYPPEYPGVASHQ